MLSPKGRESHFSFSQTTDSKKLPDLSFYVPAFCGSDRLFDPEPIGCIWLRSALNTDQRKAVNLLDHFAIAFFFLGNSTVNFSAMNFIDENVMIKCQLISELYPKCSQLLHTPI